MVLPSLPHRPLEGVPEDVGARWFVAAGVPWWALAFTIPLDAGFGLLGVAALAIVAGAIPLDEAYHRLPAAPQARLSVGGMALGLGIILLGRGNPDAVATVPRLLYGFGASFTAFGLVAGLSGIYRQVTNSADEEVTA